MNNKVRAFKLLTESLWFFFCTFFNDAIQESIKERVKRGKSSFFRWNKEPVNFNGVLRFLWCFLGSIQRRTSSCKSIKTHRNRLKQIKELEDFQIGPGGKPTLISKLLVIRATKHKKKRFFKLIRFQVMMMMLDDSIITLDWRLNVRLFSGFSQTSRVCLSITRNKKRVLWHSDGRRQFTEIENILLIDFRCGNLHKGGVNFASGQERDA